MQFTIQLSAFENPPEPTQLRGDNSPPALGRKLQKLEKLSRFLAIAVAVLFLLSFGTIKENATSAWTTLFAPGVDLDAVVPGAEDGQGSWCKRADGSRIYFGRDIVRRGHRGRFTRFQTLCREIGGENGWTP